MGNVTIGSGLGWIWGYPRRPREDPRCPVCGRWCQTVYVRWEEVLGCEQCVRAVDAWEFDNDGIPSG